MNSEPNFTTLVRRLVAVCGLLVAGIALLVLGTWVAGRWQMGTLGSDFIPMAPSTALLFLLLGAAVFIRARGAEGRAGAWFCFVAAGVALATGALFFAQALLGFDLSLEQWLASSDATLKNIPVGRMSPLTALAFVLASGALLLQSPALAGRAAARYLARCLTLGVLLGVGTVLISYGSGTPLFYGQGLVPMALPTAIAFMLLGASLLALSAREPSPELQSPPRRMWRWAATIFAALVGALTLAGWFQLRADISRSRLRVEAELSAIADLKAGQIAGWMKERRADAELSFNKLQARQFLAEPDNAAVRKELLHWMTTFQRLYDYSVVALFDARAAVRLSVPAAAPLRHTCIAEHVQAALRAREVIVTDLHRGQSDEPIHLSLLVPVGVKPQAGQPADGVLLFVIEPHRFLYPLVQNWPTPSRTAETVLVLREGDEVVYLNELRHRTNTALALRVPLNRPNYPAAMAVQGREGVFEGTDYRDISVLAASRKIPGTPWFMVAKMDQEEIYAPLRQEVWTFVLMTALLLLAGGLGLGLLWRQQKLEFSRRELADRKRAEEALRKLNAELDQRVRDRTAELAASEEKFRTIADFTYDWEYWLDPGRQFIYTSPSCERITGFAAEDFSADPGLMDKLIHPGDRAGFDEHVAQYHLGNRSAEMREMEFRIIDKSGSEHWIAHACRPITGADGKYLGRRVSNRDITERKKADMVIQDLNESLKRNTAQLEAANKELEAFSYSVSHDLRAPLRAIDGYDRILVEDYADKLDDEGRRVLGVISSETQRMGELIDDLLAFSRMGRQPMQLTQVDMNALAQAEYERCAALEPDRRIEFKLHPLPSVRADGAMLRQVLANLLSNAVKFTRSREAAVIEIGVTESPRDEVAGTAQDAAVPQSEHSNIPPLQSSIVFFVRDNGAGFDMKYADKLFGVFQRLHSTEEFEGTGVGLALVQHVIHRHVGRVWAEGKVNEGATFYFSLPNMKGKL